MRTREGAVGSRRRKRHHRGESEGGMEARETTRTGARYRARTRCGAGGESAMLPGVMRVHLNYRDSLVALIKSLMHYLLINNLL